VWVSEGPAHPWRATLTGVTIATLGGSQLGQGAYRQPFIHDEWAPLSHIIGTGVGPALDAPGVGPWMRPEDRRRLLAYQVLQAMLDNSRRHWLPRHMWTPGDPDPKNPTASFPPALQYREYGGPRTVMEAARSLVLGVEQRFHVPAADPDPHGPNPGTATSDSLPAKAQAWLDQWWKDEKVTDKLVRSETKTIGLGDSVLVLVWDDAVQRPRLRVYDPGFYFPDWRAVHDPKLVAAGWRDEDYPPVVHLAWEWTDDDGNPWIHRATFRMVPLPKPRPRPYGGVATWTCMWEQADYDPGKTGDTDVYGFPKGAGRNRVGPVDLNVDFVPVVHVPNDSEGEWGRSALLNVAQILDDMNSADTDLALNSEVVASPKLITKNATDQPATGPGAWVNLFGDGDASVLDTSKTLDALLKHSERLTQLVARHTRLGQVLLGYAQGSGESAAASGASGYALRLGFVQAEALEREMTVVRQDKYGLLARMVLRFGQANGLVPTGQTPDVVAVLGKGLPADRAASIVEVTGLLGQHAISTYTAVLMLIDAGLPIEDAQAEVKRIQSERYDVAVGIVEATGNVEAASDYMSVEYVKPEPQPADTAGSGGGFGGDTSGPPAPATPPNPQAPPGGPQASPGVPAPTPPAAPRSPGQ
jgi:hypothetical protein